MRLCFSIVFQREFDLFNFIYCFWNDGSQQLIQLINEQICPAVITLINIKLMTIIRHSLTTNFIVIFTPFNIDIVNNPLNATLITILTLQLVLQQPPMATNKYFKSDDDYDLVDIYQLFNYYNAFFFQAQLEQSFVEWSQKMTLCAGTCTHSSYNSCTIRLSAPLLRYRTANELKETLLHEMIHAFLFITNPRACLTEGGHGKQFQQIMRNINGITGLNITIFHNFQDEVNLYRKHIWKCNGSCQTKPPFYGIVKRAMNRKPQPADHWFNQHKRTCGGEFSKISAPQDVKEIAKKNKNKKIGELAIGKGKTIDQLFKQMSKQKKQNIIKRQKTTSKQKQNNTKTDSLPNCKSIAEYCQQIEQENNPKKYQFH